MHVPLVVWIACLLFAMTTTALCKGSEPPWNLAELRRAPVFTVAERQGNLLSIYYRGESYRERPTSVFAYLAYPEKRTRSLPAMALIHGGGGQAYPEWAKAWAARGYVALAMDHIGHGPDGKPMPDGGPQQDQQSILMDPDTKQRWSYHAVADVIRGISLLASLPEVDSRRIGITGISWGGYLTCIVAGLDQRIRVALPVYGCGFLYEHGGLAKDISSLPDAQRRLWIELLDPARYLKKCRIPMLFINGSSDVVFPLECWQKSYLQVRNHTACVKVDMQHSHVDGWAPVEIALFVDHHLRGGLGLPSLGALRLKGKTAEAPFSSPVAISRAELAYSADTGSWNERKWQLKEATLDGSLIRAELPDARPIMFFLNLIDSRGAVVSTEYRVLE